MVSDILRGKELLQSQLEEISNRPKKAKAAKSVQPDKAAARTYNSTLQKLVKAIRKDIDEQLIPMIKALEPQYVGDSAVYDGWAADISALFERLTAKWSSPEFFGAAKGVASAFVNAIGRNNRSRFAKSVKSVGIDVFGDSPNLENILDASVAENTRLIKSIPSQYLGQVEQLVTTNMKAGLRPSAIVSQLQERFGVTRQRATMIARDQTSKANGELSKQRQEDAGFEFFRWLDADDSRVRHRHEAISNADVGYGKGVYKWSDPPKNDKGQPIIPGQEINCRCVAQPVTSRQVAESKKNG